MSDNSAHTQEYDYRVAHLTRVFRGWRLETIDQVAVDAYIARSQAEGVVGSTIRRELGTLTKLLRLACKNKKLARVPMLDKPKEDDARAGFFEPEQYAVVRRRLPVDLQLTVAIGYAFGWRMQSEILTLERHQLDLETGALRLAPGTTKNGEGRVIYLAPELMRLLGEQLERIRAVERKTGRIIPYLFPYLSGRGRLGQRRGDFRKAWATACKEAAVPGHYRHDLRRTAVRNMERAGVPRSVAMKIIGHPTENVHRPYEIVSDADLKEVAAKLAAVGTITGTAAVSGIDPRP